MYKILIVEDDEIIARELQKHFRSWNLDADCVENFQNIIPEFVASRPQLVILDISLPFFNGYHWCSEIRKLSKVPVIFLSSSSDNMNIVMAINMGGDDFVAKPFDLNVLTAKVQALLRRTYDFSVGGDFLEYKGLLLNLSDTTLQYQDQKVELTKNEYRILQILLEQKGHVVSRDTLMQRLWESDDFVDENTLNVNITRLRKKLSELGMEQMIVTKKGLGYLVEAE